MSKGTVNKAILIGRIGQDPEMRTTASGQQVANFSIATNRGYKDRDGNKVEETDWHRLVAWGKLAEIIGEWCKKGSRIYVEGRLQTRSWDDVAGVKKYTTEIVVNEMQLLGDGSQQETPTAPAPGRRQETAPAAPDDSSVPF